MSSRHHIDDFMHGRIIGKIEKGRKITDVARAFDIAHSVVSRLWKSFKTTGMCSRRHWGGCVRSTTPAEDRYIVLSAKGNRYTTAQQVANQILAASGKQISRKTVINLDKIAEDYCEIEIFESLEIIQLDIEDINQRIETTEVGLKLLMYSLKNSENVNINLNDNGKNSIRLPQIPLPEFSGVIAEFSNFKNQFINLISNNEQLNDSQKLYYLRASLKGEAKLLESPSDSFDSLFKALEDRYENKRQLIDSHVLEIINYEKNL
ncbi:integrase catalytic domain-containing protein [Trichonephila clavipes]|nr:integrase catalytic domain-containing protein [Trichonephila clavipes]